MVAVIALWQPLAAHILSVPPQVFVRTTSKRFGRDRAAVGDRADVEGAHGIAQYLTFKTVSADHSGCRLASTCVACVRQVHGLIGQNRLASEPSRWVVPFAQGVRSDAPGRPGRRCANDCPFVTWRDDSP
jgi:hypothetical protein